jgi:hypothetical protein
MLSDLILRLNGFKKTFFFTLYQNHDGSCLSNFYPYPSQYFCLNETHILFVGRRNCIYKIKHLFLFISNCKKDKEQKHFFRRVSHCASNEKEKEKNGRINKTLSSKLHLITAGNLNRIITCSRSYYILSEYRNHM